MSYLSKSGLSLLSENEKSKTPIGVFNGVENYVQITPDATTLTYDFTADSVGSSPIDWEPLSGTFTVQSASPSIFGGAKYTRCDGAGSIKIPNIVANGVYEFDLLKADTGNAIAVSFIDNTTTGYTLNILNTEAISLSKIGSSTLLSSAASYVANATWYRFKVVRNEAGVFSVYIKSSVTGNYTLVSVSGGSGTNPVTDATTLTSKYFSVTMGLNDCIANVNISAAVGQFDLNGYERITDSQNRDFEATHFGSDLVSGWDFTSGWTKKVGTETFTANSFTTLGNGGIVSGAILTVGKTYTITIAGSTNATFFQVMDNNSTAIYAGNYTSSFNYTVTFTCVNNAYVYLRHEGAGTTTITSFSVKEVLAETNVLPAQDFTSGWSIVGSSTINTATKFTTTAQAGILKASLMTIGKTYKMRIAGYTTASAVNMSNDVSGAIYKTVTTGSFDESFIFTPQIDGTIYFLNTTAGVTEIFKMELYEIQTTWNDSYLAHRRSGLFNGIDNYVSVADNDNLDFGNMVNSTVSMFVYQSSSSPASAKILISNESFNNSGSQIRIQATTGRLYYRTNQSGVNQTTESSTAIPTGLSHIVAVKNGSSVTFYVNGVAQSNASSGTHIESVNAVNNTIIGATTTPATGFFSEKLYSIRIFNRALTAAEVLTYYNGGKPELYRTPNADFGASQTELITNGSFTGSATGWTLGTGWTYGTDNVVFTTTGVYSELSQLLGQIGKTYAVTFTLTRASGSVIVKFGSTGTSSSYSSSGTYTFYGVSAGSNSGIRFGADAAFSGSIDNVSVVQVGAVAEYKFNEVSGTTLRDYSPNNLHGTVNGTVTNFWQRENYGNHSVEISDVDKKAGTYSAKIISTGDGLGSELITVTADRDFSSDTGFWSKETGVTINSGVLRFINVNSSLGCYRSTLLSVGKTYTVTLTVSGLTSGSVKLWFGTYSSNAISSNGTFTITGTCVGTQLFDIASGINGSTLDIDNISVKEVLGEVQLPASSLNPIEAGKKFTIEAWARGTGVLGSELIVDNSFNDASKWTLPTGWSVSGGNLQANGSQTALVRANPVVNYSTGNTYLYSITITSLSGGNVEFYLNGIQALVISSIGTFSSTVISTNNDGLYIKCTTGQTCTISSISIKQVTLPSLTLQLGSQSKTISSISCVPGTFTKLVWNFLATANEVGQPIKIYTNQADVVYVDDCSLTQKKDILVNVWHKVATSVNTINCLISNGAIAPDAGIRLLLRGDQNGYLYSYVADNVVAKSVVFTTDLRSNTNYVLSSVIINATGNISSYRNGVAGTSTDITGVGKINSTRGLFVGRDYWIANYVNGNIGEVQITRFNDIAQSNVNASTAYSTYIQTGKYPQVTGGGATIIFDSKINDGNGYQIKDNSTYKKHGVLSGTITEFWNNKSQYFEQEYIFKASQISSSSATTTLLKLPANVKVIEISADIEKFSSDVTLQIGYSGSDAWLATITGTNVNDSKGVTCDKAYSSLVEKQLYIKKNAATTYGRIKLRIKFEYIKEI